MYSNRIYVVGRTTREASLQAHQATMPKTNILSNLIHDYFHKIPVSNRINGHCLSKITHGRERHVIVELSQRVKRPGGQCRKHALYSNVTLIAQQVLCIDFNQINLAINEQVVLPEIQKPIANTSKPLVNAHRDSRDVVVQLTDADKNSQIQS